MVGTEKLEYKNLPKLPGIYLFKNSENQVIYVGKAKSLQKRVASYFSKRNTDWKVAALLDEATSIEHILTHSETEALLLEAQLIRDNKPKYNVLLKSGQPFLYILVTQGAMPRLELVRNKKAKGLYFGPLLYKNHARRAYEYLIRTFQLFICNKKIESGCLDYHLGKCCGSCMQNFDIEGYKFRLQLAIDALKNTPKEFVKKIKEKIMEYNAAFEFEKSKHLHEYIQNIDSIFETLRTKFSETKFESQIFAATQEAPVDKEYSLTAQELQAMLKLSHPPSTIDCFDISHFQSRFIVGSCIRFTNGKPDKNFFRRFTVRSLVEQNDYVALQEIVSRRYKHPQMIPDLILIDGGKGQLSAVRAIMPDAPLISLAKKEETIFADNLPNGIKLDIKTRAGKLLIALRDYAHHFAISYHRLKRSKHVD